MLHPSKTTRNIFFIIIVLVAIFFRTYQLDSFPPGLYPDEAMNGNDAMEANETGKYKIYYPNNNGREGLYNNLTALTFKVFSPDVWTLKLMAVIAGVLGVIALYLLGKEMFNWQIGALSSFLMAISFWHVNFSRISFRAIFAPMLVAFAVYFFWKGLRGRHLMNFLFSGIFLGLGFYTYIAFRITPLFLIFGFLAYWHFLKQDFDGPEYTHGRNFILRGFVLLVVTTIIVALPIGIYYWMNPADFLGRTGQISVFAGGHVIETLTMNTVKTLGMFNFVGDHNWRHNIAGSPLLFWPIGVFFAAGFLRSIWKLFRRFRDHGHFAAVHILLLSWFFIGLLPVILSNEGIPHSLRALVALPVVFLFAGEGMWWIFKSLHQWYVLRDKHPHEASLVTTMVLIIFLISLGLAEYNRYFRIWGQDPITASYFNQDDVKMGEEINALPAAVPKYVVVERPGVLVNNIPMSSQTVMFISKTFLDSGQKQKNVTYLSPEEFAVRQRAILSNPQAKVFYIK